MAGEWIEAKARGLMHIFPGQWTEISPCIFEGRCPGEAMHTKSASEKDARVHLVYGASGQSPGIYCFHSSCKAILDGLNETFRTALFDKSGMPKSDETNPVKAPPRREREPSAEYDFNILRRVAGTGPPAAMLEKFFIERSPVDPRHVTPEIYLDTVFDPGDRVLVFQNFYSQGDFLHVAGSPGESYALAQERGVKAITSALPRKGPEGIWYLNQPVTAQWLPDLKGKYSRRISDCVTTWKHVVIESDIAPPDWWLRFLSIWPGYIKAIYSSGGRSWHVLIHAPYDSKEMMDVLLTKWAKKTLVKVGADPGALTSMRLTRLPGCRRGMREQKLIYLAGNPDDREIATMPPRRKV